MNCEALRAAEPGDRRGASDRRVANVVSRESAATPEACIWNTVFPCDRGSLAWVFFADAVTDGVGVLRGGYRPFRRDMTAFFR